MMKPQQQPILFLPPPESPKLPVEAHADLVELLATFLVGLVNPPPTPEGSDDHAS